MARFVTREEAQSVLPILQAHAAYQLDQMRSKPAGTIAEGLRAGTCGGNEIERLEQNIEYGLPESLDNFWRVLMTFEQLALGGEIEGPGRIAIIRGTVPQPYPWMLRAAGQAMRDQGSHSRGRLGDLAEEYCATRSPSRRDAHAIHA